MKKLLLSATLGLAALGLGAAPSQAWTFGLIPWHCVPCHGCGHCCGGCCSSICIRPYNAFSPTACGSLCLDGINPLCCNNPGCGNPGYGPGPDLGYLPDCNGCGPATVAPSSPAAASPAPATTSQAAPYNGPAPGAYGYAPTLPPTVMPMGAQPYYYPTGYGR